MEGSRSNTRTLAASAGIETKSSGNSITSISHLTGAPMAKTGESIATGPASSMDRRVLIVIELMASEVWRSFTVDLLAQKVNLSSSRLHHLFKAQTGTTPAQYLRTLRLRRAKELLETSFLNVKQIIASVGVNDRSHFEREFKKTYGVTPTQCRGRCLPGGDA